MGLYFIRNLISQVVGVFNIIVMEEQFCTPPCDVDFNHLLVISINEKINAFHMSAEKKEYIITFVHTYIYYYLCFYMATQVAATKELFCLDTTSAYDVDLIYQTHTHTNTMQCHTFILTFRISR